MFEACGEAFLSGDAEKSMMKRIRRLLCRVLGHSFSVEFAGARQGSHLCHFGDEGECMYILFCSRCDAFPLDLSGYELWLGGLSHLLGVEYDGRWSV